MSAYICQACNYETSRLNNLERHNRSKKHTEKTTVISEKVYKCDICDKILSCRQSLSRHKKYFCMIPEPKNKIEKITEDKIANSDNEIIKEVLKIATMNANIAMLNAKSNNKSISMMNYAIKYFNNAPPIKLLEEKELAGLITYESSHSIEELLIHHYDTKTLPKFLGDMIIRVYKKKNPKKQSMWATDISRLSFIVRQLVGDVGKNEWVSDKNGIKIKELIVIPFLEKIKEIMLENINNYVLRVKNNNDINNDDIENIMKNMYLSKKVVYIITKEYLHRDILKYIAPSFGIDTKTIAVDI